MPTGLKRYQQNRDAHLITFSCYRRAPLLAQPGAYEVFEQFWSEPVSGMG